jgi:hypothetical protein
VLKTEFMALALEILISGADMQSVHELNGCEVSLECCSEHFRFFKMERLTLTIFFI